MKSKWNLLAAILVSALGALTTGCYAESGYVVTNDAYTYEYDQPGLVAVGPNVWVVDNRPSVYYADNSYWMYSNDGWYRSRYASGGWVSVNAAPVIVVNHYSHRHVNGYVSAQPHVVHRSARPHTVHRPARPRVYTGQTNVHVYTPSSPAPSVRASGSVHVKAKPSHKANHTKSSPSRRPASPRSHRR